MSSKVKSYIHQVSKRKPTLKTQSSNYSHLANTIPQSQVDHNFINADTSTQHHEHSFIAPDFNMPQMPLRAVSYRRSMLEETAGRPFCNKRWRNLIESIWKQSTDVFDWCCISGWRAVSRLFGIFAPTFVTRQSASRLANHRPSARDLSVVISCVCSDQISSLSKDQTDIRVNKLEPD